MIRVVLAVLLFSVVGVSALEVKGKGPASDADIANTGDTGYPCPASGEFIKSCKWYEDFIRKNREVPKSMKEPYIYGGSRDFHNGDADMRKACKNNHDIICVKKNPLCSEYFDL